MMLSHLAGLYSIEWRYSWIVSRQGFERRRPSFFRSYILAVAWGKSR